jgi:hypothetical protein
MTIRRHDAATVAREIGKTENWVKRNARRYPHHRAGITYFWTDEDIVAMLKQMEHRPDAVSTGPTPMRRGQRAS